VSIAFSYDENIEERQLVFFFKHHCEVKVWMLFVDASEKFVDLVDVDLENPEDVINIP
jgi:hypothetical protein